MIAPHRSVGHRGGKMMVQRGKRCRGRETDRHISRQADRHADRHAHVDRQGPDRTKTGDKKIQNFLFPKGQEILVRRPELGPVTDDPELGLIDSVRELGALHKIPDITTSF